MHGVQLNSNQPPSGFLLISKIKVQKPAEVPLADEAAPVAPVAGPAYQPFDYRKFFDFSFFGGLANSFGGGNPQGFQHTQTQQLNAKPQDHLISYSVQKQFAPVHYTPVEKPQHKQPQETLETVEAAIPSEAQHVGIQKTVYFSPFVKHHHFRRHHPKRVHLLKTVEIQQ